MKHKWSRIVSPCSSKSTTSCSESFIMDDIPIDVCLIDDPGDGLEPLDQKSKKKTKGKGQKQKNKETGGDESRKGNSKKKQKLKEGKHLEQKAVVLSVTLPGVDNDMNEEVMSIMGGNAKVTEDDVSAAKALVRLQSSRCSSLVQTDTEGTEK